MEEHSQRILFDHLSCFANLKALNVTMGISFFTQGLISQANFSTLQLSKAGYFLSSSRSVGEVVSFVGSVRARHRGRNITT